MNEDLMGLLALLAGNQPPPRGMRPMATDATRVAPRRGEVQQTPHTISAYAPNDRGGIVERVRGLLGMSNLPQEPGLLGKVASFVGLNDPASMVDGPARAMAVAAKVGKVERIAEAAVRGADGKFYTGAWHGEAADKARAAGTKVTDSTGFLTSSGRYVTGEEADQIARHAKQVSASGPQGALRSEEIEELYARQMGMSQGMKR
jgi:hypothetical protein